MKTIFIISLLAAVLFIAPTAILAHGGADTDGDFGMMREIEDKALGNELHEEMEGLMTKMMSGAMTEQESERMLELMNNYPGPNGMMMGRMMATQGMAGFPAGTTTGATTGMMNGYGMMSRGALAVMGFWGWFIIVLYIVWTLVGVLAVLWLWGQIKNK